MNAERSFVEGLRMWSTASLKEALAFTLSAAMGREENVSNIGGLSESQRALLYAQELERRSDGQ